MEKIVIEEQTLAIDFNKITFDFKIDDYLILKSGVLILLIGERYNNIYFVGFDCEIIWRIDSSRFSEIMNSFYTSIASIDEKVKCYNVKGYDCTVDLETGKVIECEFVK